MNDSKIAYEFIRNNFRIEYLAETLNISKGDVVVKLFNFLKTHPESSWYSKIDQNLKKALAKDFLATPKRREEFAIEYGMTHSQFVALMKEIIEDTCLIPYDNVADRIFRKLTLHTSMTTNTVPRRIIIIMAKYYTCEKANYSQKSLAISYGIDTASLSCLLRRGISENIFDDLLAEKVYAKVRDTKRIPSNCLRAFDNAFDSRQNANV